MRWAVPVTWWPLGAAAVLCTAGAASAAAQGRYQTQDEFLHEAFAGEAPSAQVLAIDGELRAAVDGMLGHAFGPRRVRYFSRGSRTAWIFDEIGKEEPITIGITVCDGVLEKLRVLEFRESRGAEVRFPFFTDQFVDATLSPEKRLSKNIDGITGATLSVGAVTRVARLALLLDAEVHGP